MLYKKTLRNWLGFWFALASLGSTLYPTLVASEELFIDCDETDSEKCATPLNEGDIAPYSGQLLTTKLAVVLGQKAASFDIRLELELSRVEELHRLDLDLEKKKAKIDREASKEQIDLLKGRLKEAEEGLWYEHPAFVATVSVVLTVVLFYGAAYAIKSVE